MHKTIEGQLIVGYKSGGVYAFSPYETYCMGDLETLPVSDVVMLLLLIASAYVHDHSSVETACRTYVSFLMASIYPILYSNFR